MDKQIYQLQHVAPNGNRRVVAMSNLLSYDDAVEWSRDTRPCYPLLYASDEWWFGCEVNDGFVPLEIVARDWNGVGVG